MKLPVNNLIELDPRFKEVIEKFGVIELEKKTDPYKSLVKAIIYQQLSGKAASTIYKRFLNLYPSKHPTESQLISTELHVLRSVGLSNRKSEYIKTIAKFFTENKISIKDFEKMSDEEIRKQLITIKGIGHWTIDIFLMFTLNRLDVFPVLDLGIKKGFAKFFELKNMPSEKFMIKKANKWKPFQSIAAHYFWSIADDLKKY
ncbi:MAG TPA: DNA-3-methyladenine glycosylase 2 family protein [Flavobacteriaceae bacterium]|nr:DNA-3-methyladenine glycosylase 2 family protein [Flavobacteriaceae bacterium]